MPWNEVTIVSLRREFVNLALKEGANISLLCRRYNISRKTGHKWIKRFLDSGEKGLEDQSRRPLTSPLNTADEMEKLILKVRKDHPAWGGRKINQRLVDLGHTGVPAPSTITEILKRNGKINQKESEKHKAWIRFEADNPNDLWQMDFKGHFQIIGGRCHPLTVLDDNSRFSLCLDACKNERADTAKGCLIGVFRRYGMPKAILCDNGPPFGASIFSPYTTLGKWLIRLGIKLIHGRPKHPQTQGKEERFHRTLKAEILDYIDFEVLDFSTMQNEFDRWRDIYNFERPHESLSMKVPGQVYCESKREYPEVLPQIEYSPGDKVLQVRDGGRIHYQGKGLRIGKAFTGEFVAIRPTINDHKIEVYYCNQLIKVIDLKMKYDLR
ncbi:MAG TPA: IS481 family transposase [Spirochaetota bacterium]|nr:IS481 family transposase [Spirochaetota bacterium]